MTHDSVQVNKQWGLLACGSSGHWQIDVDESLDGDELSMQLNGPNAYLMFTIPNLDVIRKLLAYLQATVREAEGLPLGNFGAAIVSIIRDDEFATRWFLRVDGDGGALLHVTLDDADVRMMTDALEQVMEQLPKPNEHE